MCCRCANCVVFFFFFKQKTAYEMRISDWSSDVCSSDLFFNQGEVCSAGSRILVENTIYDNFTDGLDKRSRSIRVGDPLDPETYKIGRASCRERVCQYV